MVTDGTEQLRHGLGDSAHAISLSVKVDGKKKILNLQ
jgi:hypothetical protein